LCAFDSSGAGKSEGIVRTYGIKEAEDIGKSRLIKVCKSGCRCGYRCFKEEEEYRLVRVVG